MLLSNIFNIKLDDFVNSSTEEDVINHYQNKNVTSFQLQVTRRNRVVGHFKINKRATEKNRIANCFKRKEGIKGANENTFDVSFLLKNNKM